jgi:hypothetical protein
MQEINVQFADSTGSTIISVFGCPQNPVIFSNLGAVPTSDTRWVAYYNAQNIIVQAGLPPPTTGS